mgnify:CR=1 FL=1
MRLFLGLVIGLLVGGIGAFLYTQSLPPKKGSLAERAELAEFQLAKAHLKLDELRAKSSSERRRASSQAAVRSIAEQIRNGRQVNLDDVFKNTIKPWMRDIAPLFDRSHTVQQKRRYDRLAGDLTRKYDLDDEQQAALTSWLDRKAEAKNQRLQEVLNNESTGFVPFAMAMEEREDYGVVNGLDEFMAQTLDDATLTTFQRNRMKDRVERVQNEAEGQVNRLNSIVSLREDQQDEIFALMARSSEHFDPSMQFQGLKADTSPVDLSSRDQAIQGMLSGEQAAALQDAQRSRQQEAFEEFQQMGLSPPKGWEQMEGDLF